jgi:hypothetical protein
MRLRTFARTTGKGAPLFFGLCLIVSIVILLSRSSNGTPSGPDLSLLDSAQTGDIIFFRGTRTRSMIVRFLDPGPSTMSHLGILVRCDSSLLVAHASPYSPKGESPGVRLQPLEVVFREGEVASALLYRCTVDSAGEKAAGRARLFAESGVPFDSDFDLATDTALYCTELVSLAYLRAGVNIVTETLDTVVHPFGKKPILFPANVARSKLLRKVYP